LAIFPLCILLWLIEMQLLCVSFLDWLVSPPMQITTYPPQVLAVIVFCLASIQLRYVPKHPYRLVSFCAEQKLQGCESEGEVARPQQGSSRACSVQCGQYAHHENLAEQKNISN
jgi:hypothetical protein